jgi:negative regulator of sigma E activity
VSRALALLLVAPVLTFASGLAPQHVHEAGHGHEHAVAHSHFGPHQIVVQHDDVTEIEPDVEHVVWLDSAILHETPYHAAAAPTAIAASYDMVSVELRWSITPCDAAAPAHGPPRHSVLFRGPPPSLA